MDYIFIAFANSQENNLTQLENEDDIVYRHLNMGKRKFDYNIYRQSMSSIDKISQTLTDHLHEISIFLFICEAAENNIFGLRCLIFTKRGKPTKTEPKLPKQKIVTSEAQLN